MGFCREFGIVIAAGCDHQMQADTSSCVCPGCGVVCRGRFTACPQVWENLGHLERPVTLGRRRPATMNLDLSTLDLSNLDLPPLDLSDLDLPSLRPADESVRTDNAPTAGQAAVKANVVPPSGTEPDPAPRKPKDASRRLRAEVEAIRSLLERSYHEMAAGMATRAREIDARAAAHLRALEHDRASLPAALQQRVARMLPGMVAEAVRISLDARRVEEPSRAARAEDLRQSIADMLPGMVADAVRLEIDAAWVDQPTPDTQEGPRSRSDHDRVSAARQRSLEKWLDGLTRRAQEIDDRVTTHLRAIDDDRAALTEITLHQERLERSVAESAGRHDQLVAWVDENVPGRVAAAVQTTMEAHAPVLTAHSERAERALAAAEALSKTVQEASERTMEALYRRDLESDERAAAHQRILEDEQAVLTALRETGRDEVAQSVIDVLPAMIDSAVRTAMDRYATERRTSVRETANQVHADLEVMREGLQRSFEKMMEVIAVREQQLDEREAANARMVDHERAELAALRDEVVSSLAEATPVMVADAVRSATALLRADVDAARADAERLRVESEKATDELRAAVAELKAELADREKSAERQARASELALEGLRSAVARPATRTGHQSQPSSEPPIPVEVVADETNGGRVAFGKSTVPRERRMERRLLKIDDRDDSYQGPWPGLDRRQRL